VFSLITPCDNCNTKIFSDLFFSLIHQAFFLYQFFSFL
jgi:hypothetical protein